MTGRVAALLAVLLLLGGCRLHHDASEEASTTSHRITVNGVARTYLVHTPLRLPPKAPLVVMIHAGAGSGEPSSAAQAEAEYGWDGLAEDHHFLVAYPDGLDHSWDLGARGDVGFLSAMVRELVATGAVDPTRIYAVGALRGGALAYRLACTTDLLTAVGAAGGYLLGDCPAPHPTSVLQLETRADDRPSLDVWQRAARCHRPQAVRSGALTARISVCPDGRAVELITGSSTDPWPATGPDATAAFWQFFDNRNVTLS